MLDSRRFHGCVPLVAGDSRLAKQRRIAPTVFLRILNPPINQNLNDKLGFIGVLYFVVGEDIILPQRTITACFREANSLPYGVCAKLQHTDKSKFEITFNFQFSTFNSST